MPQFLVWKEDENQDKIIESGDFVLLEDQDAVIQQLGTNIRLAKNDWFTDLNEGLRWIDNNERGILGSSSLSLENEAEIIAIINSSFGVKQLISLQTDFTSKTSLLLSISVTTIFSEIPAIINISVS